MKHYSRENQRSQARIDELERWKTTYEASLAVMGACWAQVRQFPSYPCAVDSDVVFAVDRNRTGSLKAKLV